MANSTSKHESVRGDDGTHFHGHGRITSPLATPEMIELRARELALIAGREPNRVAASDRIQAKKELLGDESGDRAVDETEIVAEGMGSPPVSHGQHVKNHLPTDDEDEANLAEEGVELAEHEQMLEAGKSHTRNKG